MTTIYPNELEKGPKPSSINTMDMVSWWTNKGDGNFNWQLYRKIIDAKRYLLDNNNYDINNGY
jgi:hypothetical protein